MSCNKNERDIWISQWVTLLERDFTMAFCSLESFLAMVNTNVGGSFEKYGCMKKKFPNCERGMLII